MKTVVYAAKSTTDVHASIPDQLTRSRAQAESEGREVVAEFTDEGFSAYSGSRGPGLAKAKEQAAQLAAEEGQAELWVLHSDRLARGGGAAPGDAMHLAELWFEMRRAGVQLRSVEDDRSLQDLVLVAVMGDRNHEDSKRKSSSVKAGHLRRVSQRGLPVGKRNAYGYAQAPSFNEPRPVIEHERSVVVRIFEQVAAGQSRRRVAQRLARDHVPTQRGGRWTSTAVSELVRKPFYKGWILYGGELFRGIHEPIVSEELWAAANRALDLTAQTPTRGRPPKDIFLLRHELRCGLCGASMVVRSRTGHYTCITWHHDRQACPMPPVRRAIVDDAVFRYFELVGLDREKTRDLMLASATAELDAARTAVEAAEIERGKLGAQYGRMWGLLKDGKIDDDDWLRFKAEHREAVEGADAELAQLAERRRTAEDAPQRLKDDVLERLAAIREAIASRVTADRDLEAVREALRILFTGFTLHRVDESTGRLEAELWMPAHAAYLEPHVRPEVLRGWVSDRRITPVLDRQSVLLVPTQSLETNGGVCRAFR